MRRTNQAAETRYRCMAQNCQDSQACLVLCSGFGRFWVWAQPEISHACQSWDPLYCNVSPLAHYMMAIAVSMQSFPGDAIFCGERDPTKVEAPSGSYFLGRSIFQGFSGGAFSPIDHLHICSLTRVPLIRACLEAFSLFWLARRLPHIGSRCAVWPDAPRYSLIVSRDSTELIGSILQLVGRACKLRG